MQNLFVTRKSIHVEVKAHDGNGDNAVEIGYQAMYRGAGKKRKKSRYEVKINLCSEANVGGLTTTCETSDQQILLCSEM